MSNANRNIPLPKTGGNYVYRNGKLVQVEKPTAPAAGKTADRLAKAKAETERKVRPLKPGAPAAPAAELPKAD